MKKTKLPATHLFLFLLIALMFMSLLQSHLIATKIPPAPASPPTTTGQVKAAIIRKNNIIVDHTSLPLFDQIPPQYLEAARDLRMLFIDRSVGANINEGLNCLAYPNVAATPSFCKRPDLAISELVSGPQYNRSQWLYQFWNTGLFNSMWHTLVPAFIAQSTPQLSQLDVLSYQPSYLEVMPGSTITDPDTGFFVDHPTQIQDIYDLERFELEHADKAIIYWTSSLARSIGSEASTEFNDQLRQFAVSGQKLFLDAADILSHNPQGNPCYDNRDGVAYTLNGRTENYPDDGHDYPAICPEYTTEFEGGHLGSYSAGMNRMAQAVWILMAQISGWYPDSQTPPTNQAPTVSLTATQPALLNLPVTLQAFIHDDNLPTNHLTYTWQFVSGPTPVTITNPAQPNVTFTPSLTGPYTFSLTVSDGQLATTTSIQVMVVSPSPTPPPPTTGPTSAALTFDTLPNLQGECPTCTAVALSTDTSGYNHLAGAFNGQTSQVTLPNHFSISNQATFNLSLWVKPAFDETETQVRHYLLTDGNAVQIFYLPQIKDWRALVRLSRTDYRLDTNNLTWDPNTWHELRLSYDGRQLILYWDGVQHSRLPATGMAAADPIPTYLGYFPIYNYHFLGSLDDLTLSP
ncbi:hypothetical protein A2W24_04080 [Microgenomates group bacterium RBG_16_45_19]|nr:MAG: hypothetical protein A2W24_04080 [Microgenomates group bacterium RBG_16_45_19]